MRCGLLGKKLGMTHVFGDGGVLIPVTVIKAGPCPILQIKDEARDGYRALQLGFDDMPVRVANKPELGKYERLGITPKRFVREFRVDSVEEYEEGETLSVELFYEGDKIKITGRSKGRGFSGAMKRHGFAGKGSSHGTHKVHRKVGSIGMASWPSRVFRGKRMPGHYGETRVTTKNLKVVKIMPEQNLLLIKGAVPGARGSYLIVSK